MWNSSPSFYCFNQSNATLRSETHIKKKIINCIVSFLVGKKRESGCFRQHILRNICSNNQTIGEYCEKYKVGDACCKLTVQSSFLIDIFTKVYQIHQLPKHHVFSKLSHNLIFKTYTTIQHVLFRIAKPPDLTRSLMIFKLFSW